MAKGQGIVGSDHDRFEYCVDDPVNAVDPRGLRKEEFSALKKAGSAAGLADWWSKASTLWGLIELKNPLDEFDKKIKERDKKWDDDIKNERVEEIEKTPERNKDIILKTASEVGKTGVKMW